jgi:hypothetical protein
MSEKQIILQSAARLFSERGFKETPTSELSKLTGAAEGTIFYHFENKEELFVAILKDLRERPSPKSSTGTPGKKSSRKGGRWWRALDDSTHTTCTMRVPCTVT